MSTTEKRQKVVKSHLGLSMSKQCKLLNINRTAMYYKPKGESLINIKLMKDIDKWLLDHPYYGVERMTDYLNLDLGYRVNVKRVRRLYKQMRINTIYPKPKTTKRDPKAINIPICLKG